MSKYFYFIFKKKPNRYNTDLYSICNLKALCVKSIQKICKQRRLFFLNPISDNPAVKKYRENSPKYAGAASGIVIKPSVMRNVQSNHLIVFAD